MSRYFDRQGRPMGLMEWARAFEKNENKIVLQEKIGNVMISTVWLGLDHQFGHGPPLIFETMIFGGDHDEEQWRYSTEAEAMDGHRAAVSLVENHD